MAIIYDLSKQIANQTTHWGRDVRHFCTVIATSGSRTSETGAKFWPKFFNDLFLGVSRQNIDISPKIFIYLPKFLMTFFLVIELF